MLKMRTATIITLLLSFSLQAQTLEQKLKQYARVTPLFIVSGIASGYHHNSSPLNGHKMMQKHPNWDPEFNDGRISHYRKWKLQREFTLGELYTLPSADIIYTRDGSRVERYLGSSTVFVPFTDLWHLSQAVERTTYSAGYLWLGYMSYKEGGRQRWYWYAADLIIPMVIHNITFELTDKSFN